MPVVFSNFRSLVCSSALLFPLSPTVFANIPAAYLACEGAVIEPLVPYLAPNMGYVSEIRPVMILETS